LSDVLSTPLASSWFVVVVAVGLVIGAPFFATALQVALEKRLRQRTLRTLARSRRATGASMSDPMRAAPKHSSTEHPPEIDG
jgi:hypothetical protein